MPQSAFPAARTTLLTLLLSFAGASAQAHHAFVVEYDLDRLTELTGTITRTRFIYPHSWIYIDVDTASGTSEEWAIEGATPATLRRRGWDSDSVAAGTRISVKGYPALDAARRIAGWEIRLADGTILFVASAGISHLRPE